MKVVPSVELGEFDVPAVPRKGELIVVWDGWCGERVEEVWYGMDDEAITVEIGPDYSGEYTAEVARRKVVKP